MRFYDKIEIVDINNVSVSKLAKLTPGMIDKQFLALKNSIKEIGQQEPVLVYKGEIVDGRHRYKALTELEANTIKCKYIYPDEKLSDIKDYILKVSENRRHQTPTQKAIYAYYIYLDEIKDHKVSQGEIAENCGTTRQMLSRAKKLDEIAGKEVLEYLFKGNKINIGRKEKPIFTDSLLSLTNHYKKIKDEPLLNSQNYEPKDLTDEEKDYIEKIIDRINTETSDIVALEIARKIYAIYKPNIHKDILNKLNIGAIDD